MTVAHILALLAVAAVTSAHTWVEQMQNINSNGSYTGAMGYARGYVSRTGTGFNGNSDDYLLPPLVSGRTRINSSDLLCHPAQRVANQTDGYPMLTTSPGNYIAMKYLENGHVTLPQNQPGKPPAGGSVYIFSTTSPKDDEKLTDVLQWTSNGSGGDGRGRLITANNFDDGRCHQLNGGALSLERQKEFPDRVPGQPDSNVEQWCEADVPIPTDMTSGIVTLYFVWDWPTRAGEPGLPDGKDEYYTSCADVSIVPSGSATSSAAYTEESSDPNALVQQDPQTKAVETYSARSAFKMNPLASYATSGTGYETGYGAYPTAAANGAAAKVATSAYTSSASVSASMSSSSAQATSLLDSSAVSSASSASFTYAPSTTSSCADFPFVSISVSTVRFNSTTSAAPSSSAFSSVAASGTSSTDDIVYVTAHATTTVTILPSSSAELISTSTVSDISTVLVTSQPSVSAMTPSIITSYIVSTTDVPPPVETTTSSSARQKVYSSQAGNSLSFGVIYEASPTVKRRHGRGHLGRARW